MTAVETSWPATSGSQAPPWNITSRGAVPVRPGFATRRAGTKSVPRSSASRRPGGLVSARAGGAPAGAFDHRRRVLGLLGARLARARRQGRQGEPHGRESPHSRIRTRHRRFQIILPRRRDVKAGISRPLRLHVYGTWRDGPFGPWRRLFEGPVDAVPVD